MNLEIIMLSEKSQMREFMPGVCSQETLQKAERSAARSAGREKREGGARRSGVVTMVFTFAAMATLTSLASTHQGSWVAGSVKHLTQVMISQLVGSSPMSGSVLTARSPEPASDSVSPSLSDPPPLVLCLS